jgi:hypothetical protein
MDTRLIVLGAALAACFVIALASRHKGPSFETVEAVSEAVLEERARLATEHNPYMRKGTTRRPLNYAA